MAKQAKKSRADTRGIVRVQVTLQTEAGERIRGNITRAFRVRGATVSAVANALETAFDRQEAYTLKR